MFSFLTSLQPAVLCKKSWRRYNLVFNVWLFLKKGHIWIPNLSFQSLTSGTTATETKFFRFLSLPQLYPCGLKILNRLQCLYCKDKEAFVVNNYFLVVIITKYIMLRKWVILIWLLSILMCTWLRSDQFRVGIFLLLLIWLNVLNWYHAGFDSWHSERCVWDVQERKVEEGRYKLPIVVSLPKQRSWHASQSKWLCP